MSQETKGRILPEPGQRLPLPETVQQAREALARAVELLRQFQGEQRYPQVTRNEAERAIGAIQSVDAMVAKLDPPFLVKS
jgi:hypothetical protein